MIKLFLLYAVVYHLPYCLIRFFVFIILLAFKHTHLISSLEVLPCIPLHLLSSCTFRAFFDKPPCPTSLNIVLYPIRWRPPLTVPRQKLLPPCQSDANHPSRNVFFPHKAVPQIHVSHILFFAKPLNHPVHGHPLRVSVSLYPVPKHW